VRVVAPDITRRHMAINIRKFVLEAHSLDELVALGTITAPAARFLGAAVASGLNILVSGGTQAGKTTLLSCLCASIPARERTAMPFVRDAWTWGSVGPGPGRRRLGIDVS
jgi:pilus assembly protein CpaF